MRKKSTSVLIIAAILVIVSLPLLKVFLAIFSPLFTGNIEAYGLLANERLIHLFFRSFLLALSVVVVTTLIAFPFALLFVRYKFPCSGKFLFLLLVPFFIPPYIQSIAWIYMMGHEGWLNHFFADVFGFAHSSFNIYGFWGSVFLLSLWLYPVMLVFFIIALSQGNYFSEVAGLFQNRWMVLRKIILPLGKHAVGAGIALVFALAITNFSVPGILELNVYPVEIFSQIGAFFNFRDASILSIPYFLLAMGFILLFIVSTKKMFRYSIHHAKKAGSQVKTSARFVLMTLLVLFLLIVLVFPVIALTIETNGLSTFLNVFKNNSEALMNSVFLSLAGACLITILGFFLALSVTKTKTIHSWLAFLLIIPVFIYGGLYGIGLIETWNLTIFQNSIYGNFPIIILGYLRFLPIGFFLIYAGMIKIPNAYQEVSNISGRNRRIFYFKIFIPLVRPSLVASFFISFIFCFTELDTTLLVYPPGIETLPVSIFSLLHYGANESVAAICLIQMLTIALLFSVFFKNFELKILK